MPHIEDLLQNNTFTTDDGESTVTCAADYMLAVERIDPEYVRAPAAQQPNADQTARQYWGYSSAVHSLFEEHFTIENHLRSGLTRHLSGVTLDNVLPGYAPTPFSALFPDLRSETPRVVARRVLSPVSEEDTADLSPASATIGSPVVEARVLSAVAEEGSLDLPPASPTFMLDGDDYLAAAPVRPASRPIAIVARRTPSPLTVPPPAASTAGVLPSSADASSAAASDLMAFSYRPVRSSNFLDGLAASLATSGSLENLGVSMSSEDGTPRTSRLGPKTPPTTPTRVTKVSPLRGGASAAEIAPKVLRRTSNAQHWQQRRAEITSHVMQAIRGTGVAPSSQLLTDARENIAPIALRFAAEPVVTKYTTPNTTPQGTPDVAPLAVSAGVQVQVPRLDLSS